MALVLHGTISDNTGVSVLSRPNTKPIIINGDMQIAQRSTSATTSGNGNDGYHTCDRWRFSELGAPTGEFTLSQDTDVPTGYGYRTSLSKYMVSHIRHKFENIIKSNLLIINDYILFNSSFIR